MIKNLVIVESPAKAKTIEKFLGKDYVVKSSIGHIRDLAKKNFGIDINNNYEPQYIVPDDKKKIVAELKKYVKETKIVWLASDEDREGEAIAWHLFDELGLTKENTKRIVFHEITKDAIHNAIKNPRDIDNDLVLAQQARRILDRLVGFELSPILWRKVRPSLSAGRVQSVAVKLLVEREREIINFKSEASYKVEGIFKTNNNDEFKADLSKRLKSENEVKEFLEKSKVSEFKVSDIVKKPGKKSPTAPFTTSTLQQEASRKLGFSVSQTMSIAQKLYEAGKITYMRTDSVNLSKTATDSCKNIILEEFGEKYLKIRKFKTKSKGAQEAHEAIRPTYITNKYAGSSARENKLYELIWKRTLASQMSDAILEKTTINIDNSNYHLKFITKGEILKFDGFLKVYLESFDDENENDNNNITKGLLPNVSIDELLENLEITATERFTYHPPRYTEASLVKKLEELGIGRPSTYAPTIATVQNRGYIIKEDRDGVERKYSYFLLKNTTISNSVKKEITGAEKSKLFPTDIGMVVNDFLTTYFEKIMSYNFTASVEKEFDEIAKGNIVWNKMIDYFYKPFHKVVEFTLEKAEKNVGTRLLGKDPKTDRNLYVKIGPYGPMAQIGEKDEEEKPKFASLQKGQHIETITIEDALELFKLPRELGHYEDKVVVAAIGRFGPYIRHDSKFASLKKGIDNPYKITLKRAIELIEEKKEKDRNKIIKIFDEDKEIQVLNGRWGAYISYKKKNYRIPKETDPEKMTIKNCLEIIEKNPKTNTTKKKKTVAKKKKTVTKKKQK
ncbi:MAG: type I DNA topoisomerase [Bacteroidales bacterium]|jgi:DNA topoisomerase-1|nr:type I DNA topoisomerase [Bacteroidales bacterium]